MDDGRLFLNRTFLSAQDEELSQAVARIVIITISYLFFMFNIVFLSKETPPQYAQALIVLFAVYPFVHYAWVKSHRGNPHIRRVIAVINDITTATTAIHLLEWGALYVFPLYLWIIFGNGIRFGSRYLFLSMGLTIIEFGYILSTHPTWMTQPQMGQGMMGVIVILPLFFLVMIKRLESANKKLEEELKLRKQQEAIMIQQSRNAAMGEMIGNIAHQWRQPLNALSLLLQNIIFSYESGRLDKEMMKRVNEKGNFLINTMSATIDDFRNFFRPNRDIEPFRLSDQIDKTLDMVQASLEAGSITVEKNIQSDLVGIGFPNEFAQVLLNLISNAKDALVDHPGHFKRIRIESSQSGDFITVHISDTAGGIDDAIIDKVFDPYFTTKDEGKGTGIGLYMSKVIIEDNMHGSLSVKNNSEGAVFTLTIPAQKGTA